ncbi:hypothetical protein [Streptomyces monashensis]|uniref:Lipoprotein n=1 Tax=Streptomyces monashensis TaxID=1678012 RepID=A0A1S2Q524_9ACTN|nr:hypothetical protein [Streptomyces monashensis]OIK01218.1 hypothetical protein BIV23_26115 [Streptomyces monashensis]
MDRRLRPLATATAGALTVLLLAACGGGGGDSKGNGKIAGAETGNDTPTSPSASASSPDGRPKFTLPSDLTLTFEESNTGDATKDAVLADSAERMRAVDAAITGTDSKGEALAYYNTGKALEAAVSWVAQFKQAHATVTGEVRYYDRKVTLETNKTSATLVFCADESKGFSKDMKTGKIAKTPVTKNSYVLYNTRLDKNADGVWQTSQIISSRGATQCQP